MKDTKKKTIFDNNNNYTVNINTKSDLICEDLIQSNLKLIHSHIVSNHLSQRPPNKVLQYQTPSVSPAELLLSRETRRTLAQLRTKKSPLLVSYLFSIGDPRHPSPLCPLCLMHDHTSSHLFECKSLPTSLSSLDLWTNPDKVKPFLATWGRDCWLPHDFGCWTLLAARWWSGVDNNNNNNITNCMTHILNTNNTILTGDFNAHHTLWHSPTTDNRGTLIADLINSSNQIVLNTNTPTRIPTNRNQQATSQIFQQPQTQYTTT